MHHAEHCGSYGFLLSACLPASVNENVVLEPTRTLERNLTYLNINGLFYFGRIVMFYCRDCSHSSLSQFSEQFSRQPAVTSIFQLLLLNRNKMLLDLWAELWDVSSVEMIRRTVVDG